MQGEISYSQLALRCGLLLALLSGFLVGLLWWQQHESVPEVRLPEITALPDFAAMTDVTLKKQRFFQFLQPLVERQNQRVLQLREQLQSLAGQAPLSAEQQRWLLQLAAQYRVSAQVVDEAFFQQLLLRVDSLPPALVLAQAANESAWGTSRFARLANNLFGQWCFQPGCGLVPKQRPAEAVYEVTRFASVDAAIEAYFNNLNSHPAYARLREIRHCLRQQGQVPAAVALAEGVAAYSARGYAYVDELAAMIRFNRLEPAMPVAMSCLPLLARPELPEVVPNEAAQESTLEPLEGGGGLEAES